MSLFFRIWVVWYFVFTFIHFRGPRDFINRRGLLIQGGEYIYIYIYIYRERERDRERESERDACILHVRVYIYIYIHTYMCIYIYIHIIGSWTASRWCSRWRPSDPCVDYVYQFVKVSRRFVHVDWRRLVYLRMCRILDAPRGIYIYIYILYILYIYIERYIHYSLYIVSNLYVIICIYTHIYIYIYVSVIIIIEGVLEVRAVRPIRSSCTGFT